MSTNTRSRQNEAQKSNYTGSAYGGSAEVRSFDDRTPSCTCYNCTNGCSVKWDNHDDDAGWETVEREGKSEHGTHETGWNDADGSIAPESWKPNRSFYCLQAGFPHPAVNPSEYVGARENQQSGQLAYGVARVTAMFNERNVLPDWIRESKVRDEARSLDIDVSAHQTKGGYSFIGLVAVCRLLKLSDEDQLALMTNDSSHTERDGLVEVLQDYADQYPRIRRKVIARDLLTEVRK